MTVTLKSKSILSIFLVLLLLPVLILIHSPRTKAAGTTFYIDCDNGQDSNSGTSTSTTWKTLDNIRERTLQPGDTFRFKRGCTFDMGYGWGSVSQDQGLMVEQSGTNSAPITFTDYGSGNPVIFTNSYSGHIWVRAFYINASYIIIENFKFDDVNEDAIYFHTNTQNNIVRNVEVTNSGRGVNIKGSHHLVTNSYFHDLRMVLNDPNPNDDYGELPIVLSGDNNEISYNRFINNIDQSDDYVTEGGAIDFYTNNNTSNSISNNNIHHNITQDSNGFIEIFTSNNAVIANNIIAHNISINNARFLTIHLSGGGRSQVSNLQVHHNTIYENPAEYNFLDLRSPWVIHSFWNTAPNNNTMIEKNNIYHIKGFNKFTNFTGYTHTNNLYFLTDTEQNLTLDPTDISSDPAFVNVSSKNLRLQAGSPAIDKGADLGYTADYDDNSIPVGPAPDIGAFEYQNSTPSEGCKADYNDNGIVDISDFGVFAQNYKQEGIECTLDIVGDDCHLGVADFGGFAQVYKDQSACL